jgi:type II secretory pathway component PulF
MMKKSKLTSEEGKQSETESIAPERKKTPGQSDRVAEIPSRTKRTSFLTKIHIPSEEKYYILENISLLLSSGMDILSAVKAVREGLKSERTKKIIDGLIDRINEGTPLWRSVQEIEIFSPNVIYLMRVGEESGQLPDNLKVIVRQLQKEKDLKGKVRSAMMYPMIVMALTFVVGVSIAIFILPRLSRIFSELKLTLPLLTRILIGSGEFLQKYGLIALPLVVIVSGVIFYFLFIHAKTKFIGQGILFQIPGVRKLIQEVEISRFGFILGTLLSSGIQITAALNSLYEGTTFIIYQNFYKYLKGSVEIGNSFQKSFLAYKKMNKLIPIPIQQMMIAAEQSGHLADTLLRVSKSFEKKTHTTTKNLSTILEPLLLFFVWLIVVGVALAVILPIYSLIGGLNK